MANNVDLKFKSEMDNLIQLMSDLLVESVHVHRGFTQFNCLDGSVYLYDGEALTKVR